jgi:nitrite reductase/ring-hydroxylating ferredoxin subunit
MSRAALIAMAKRNLAHARAGTIDQESDIARIPASHYFDEARFRREIDRVWKRMPLMLATTAELPAPGDYKATEAVGVPVLIVRGQDGRVRAFVNSCRHRGAVVAVEPRGNARRFSCPYHAWTYDQEGALVSVFRSEEFGEVDKSCNGLTTLKSAERAGLIWVVLDPHSPLDIDTFLCGYDGLLEHFGFATWHYFASRRLEGPNWKIAYDGYMDLYHLPVLHRNTFGPQMPSQALYTAWGPHQRVSSPDLRLADLFAAPEKDWSTAVLVGGVWTIFPHISIASFDGGGRGVMISQLFPGESAATSYTIQNYLMEKPPTPEQEVAAKQQFALLEIVVRDEDYATGIRQQKALMAGGLSHVMFGRNEGGGQRFHGWLDRLLDTPDDRLNALFAQSERPVL